MSRTQYHCGPFDIEGFATENYVYPPEWKAAMFFISFGFIILSGTVFLTLITCCRQSIMGKSIHTITGSAQMISGKHILFQVVGQKLTERSRQDKNPLLEIPHNL